MERLETKQLPWREAERLLESGRKPYSLSDENVRAFISAVAQLVLSDPSVKLDIEKRLKSGSGERISCCHDHAHDHTCGSFLDRLIQDAFSPEQLDEMAAAIVEEASRTFENVLDRGRKAGDSSMDSETEKYIRGKIFTETIVRKIVKSVQAKHAAAQARSSVDGSLFALAATEDMDLDQISSTCMAALMRDGVCVMKHFLKSDRSATIVKELTRMDALGKLEKVETDKNRSDKICWAKTQDKSVGETTRNLLQKLSWLPFELNRKNKSLMLQIIEHFQLSVFAAETGQHNMHADNGRKFSAILALGDSSPTSEAAVRCSQGSSICVNSGNLILIDTRRVQYECPRNSRKRFHITTFFTGPPN